MSIEHDFIHFETSSVLIRQLPLNYLKRPQGWNYAVVGDNCDPITMILVSGKEVELGKKDFSLFGWDNEYGNLKTNVSDFYASKSLISNLDFLSFIEDGGYSNDKFWNSDALEWRKRFSINSPKFWVKEGEEYKYRALFDELSLPLNWPVEVNYYEAEAFCNWKGDGFRVMSEAEYRCIESEIDIEKSSVHSNNNLDFCSPTPVDYYKENDKNKFHDIVGNVWQWINTDFYPLPGFKPHPYYLDFSTPYFDKHHIMMLGGSWSTIGASSSQDYRLWFRRNFYQHAGFRLAKSAAS